MWAHFARKIEREFHLIECVLEVGAWNGLNKTLAFVANDVGLISANETVETATAIGFAEQRMRNRSAYNVLVIHLLDAGCSDDPIA